MFFATFLIRYLLLDECECRTNFRIISTKNEFIITVKKIVNFKNQNKLLSFSELDHKGKRNLIPKKKELKAKISELDHSQCYIFN